MSFSAAWCFTGNHDDDPLELDRVNHVGLLVLHSIHIIRLRISKL